MAFGSITGMLAFLLLGLSTGLRTMTPIAVLCWFAYLGYLPVQGTWAFWTAHIASVALFTVFALGEYVGDKLPQTPNRISPAPLMARVVFGGLVGAIAATASKTSTLEGAIVGAVGASVGAFAGFSLRRDLVKKLGCPDWQVAAAEDLFALTCALFATKLVISWR